MADDSRQHHRLSTPPRPRPGSRRPASPQGRPQLFSQIQVASFCLDLEDQRASYTGPGSDYPIVYCAGLEPARAVLVERPDATRPNNTEHDEGDR